MNKQFAMSTLGYAIVLVIILGIVMIMSAPMLVNNASNNKKNLPEENIQEQTEYSNLSDEIKRVEDGLSSRIDILENSVQRASEKDIGKYVCTKESTPENELEPIDGTPKRFVFVCEYRR